MKLSTKYYLSWVFMYLLITFIEDSLSVSLLIGIACITSFLFGVTSAHEKTPKGSINLEEVKGQWD